jgi:hypothetical protein
MWLDYLNGRNSKIFSINKTHSQFFWGGLFLPKLTVSICWLLVLEADTIQCNSFILHVCLHVISRFLIVEFQRMYSGEMTDDPAVCCFQTNLFNQAKNARSTPMANTVCERQRWSLPSVAITIVVYRTILVVSKYTKLANGSHLGSDPFIFTGYLPVVNSLNPANTKTNLKHCGGS